MRVVPWIWFLNIHMLSANLFTNPIQFFQFMSFLKWLFINWVFVTPSYCKPIIVVGINQPTRGCQMNVIALAALLFNIDTQHIIPQIFCRDKYNVPMLTPTGIHPGSGAIWKERWNKRWSHSYWGDKPGPEEGTIHVKLGWPHTSWNRSHTFKEFASILLA